MSKIVEFAGTVERKIYQGFGEFRIYAMSVDPSIYPDIVQNQYGNVSIKGDIIELDPDVVYSIVATEEDGGKYGISYNVKKITRHKPTTGADVYKFLQCILTDQQADVLYKEYPDIIDIILSGKTIDFTKTKGIKEKTFEKIKKKVVENFAMMDVMSKYDGILPFTVIQRLFDKYTSTEMIDKKLSEDPYDTLCGISRVGFLKADTLIQEIDRQANLDIANGKEPVIQFDEPVITSKQRCLFCIIYNLDQNELNGNTYIGYTALRNLVSAMTQECIDHFSECLGDDRIYCDISNDVIANKHTYETEKTIAEMINEGLSHRTAYDIKDIDQYREIDGKTLTDEQFCILKMVSMFNVNILNGNAGSGKSQTIAAVIKMLNDNYRSYMLMAPTGKAAKVLKEYTGYNATTIHRGLGYKPGNGENGDWSYNQSNKLQCDVVIVDEMSMVDISLFKHLLDAIDFETTKLLMVGDDAQLPSVGCGNVLHDLLATRKIPKMTLTKIFRYADGGLMKVATDIRMSTKYLEPTSKHVIPFCDDYSFIDVDPENQDQVLSRLIMIYRKLLSTHVAPADIQVLSAMKVGDFGGRKINSALQKIANLNYGSKKMIKVGEVEYYEGDIVIQIANNYKACVYDPEYQLEDASETFIANGETGVVKEIIGDTMIIEFPDATVLYDKNDIEKLDLGYCMTVHKSQGSSSQYVIYITPKTHTYMTNSNLMYVAITRTQKRCFHIGMRKTVNYCLTKKEDYNRNTLLKTFLEKHEIN